MRSSRPLPRSRSGRAPAGAVSFTAAAAARALRCRLLGPDHVVVRSADELNRARPGSLTWVKRLDADAGGRLVRLAGALVILPRSSPADASGRSLARVVARRNAVIITSRPRLACARLLRRFFSALELTAAGVNPGATVHPSARLGPGVGIGPHCWVGPGVRIGAGTVLLPGAVVHLGTRIGRNCVVGSNAVLGGRGFGFIRRPDGRLEHFPQTGTVVVEDDVSIGSGTTVDRPGLGTTRIRRGTKIDNLCHIGHNASVGPDAVVTACTEVGAGVRVGARAWLGPQGCSIEGVAIGPGAFVGIGTTVLHDVPPGQTAAGSPARPIDEQRRLQAALARLVEERRQP